MKLLVVDDDAELRPLIAFAMRSAGYLTLEADSGERALELVATEAPDLLILDVNLPGIDGFEVCRQLRSGGQRVAILMLTVQGAEESQVQGLDLGADDYLSKPFSPRTLLARVRALLRRTGLEREAVIVVGQLQIDEHLQSVRIAGGAPQRLAELEFRLLQLLAANAGRTVPSARIVRHVWGAREIGERQHLKQLVHRVRQKLEEDPARPRRLCNDAGIGYRLMISES